MVIDEFLINYILLAVLLFLSFYFSGSETAIFSLNRLERNALRHTKSPRKNKTITYLLNNQEQLLVTILTGNMIVNIFASSIGGIVGDRIFAGNSQIISIIGMTVLLLLTGELTPKRIAVNHSKSFTQMTAVSLFYLHKGLTPVRFFLNHISSFVLARFPDNMGTEKIDRHGLILSTVELGLNRKILGTREYSLFKSYFSFKSKGVNAVMTPRNELKTLSCELTIGEILTLLSEDRKYLKNSTVLLHKKSSDNIVGWISSSTLLSYRNREDRDSIKIKAIAQKFQIVPESKKLPLLISEMRETETPVVLVLDEYGGTAGVLWFRNMMEDLLKAYYHPSRALTTKQEEGIKTISGAMALEELADLIPLDSSSDAVTAAGFFLEKFGKMPLPGDRVNYGEYEIKVYEMKGNRITSLTVEKKADL